MSVSIESEQLEPAGSEAGRTKRVHASETVRTVADRVRAALKNRALVGVLVASGGLLLLAAISTVVGGLGSSAQPFIYYAVVRGDLPITVTERGNLESQDNVRIICEVDDIERDGIDGTMLLYVVPNGSTVKKGDLLAEFDAAT